MKKNLASESMETYEATEEDAIEAGVNDSVFDWFYWKIGLKSKLSPEFKRKLKLLIDCKFMLNLKKKLEEAKTQRKETSDKLFKLLDQQLHLISSIKQARPLFSKNGEPPNIIELDFQSRYEMSLFDQSILRDEIAHLDSQIMEMTFIISTIYKKINPLLEQAEVYIKEVEGLRNAFGFEIDQFKNQLFEDHITLEDGENRIYDAKFLHSQTIGKKISKQTLKKEGNAFKNLLDSLKDDGIENTPENIKSKENTFSSRIQNIPNLESNEKEKNQNSFHILIPTT